LHQKIDPVMLVRRTEYLIWGAGPGKKTPRAERSR
jgi:hypothetical protein